MKFQILVLKNVKIEYRIMSQNLEDKQFSDLKIILNFQCKTLLFQSSTCGHTQCIQPGTGPASHETSRV